MSDCVYDDDYSIDPDVERELLTEQARRLERDEEREHQRAANPPNPRTAAAVRLRTENNGADFMECWTCGDLSEWERAQQVWFWIDYPGDDLIKAHCCSRTCADKALRDRNEPGEEIGGPTRDAAEYDAEKDEWLAISDSFPSGFRRCGRCQRGIFCEDCASQNERRSPVPTGYFCCGQCYLRNEEPCRNCAARGDSKNGVPRCDCNRYCKSNSGLVFCSECAEKNGMESLP